ncbi:hypothetical protein M8C21_006691, partial [Ambrosia artemisiifolia]
MEIKKRSCVVGLILIWFLLIVTISADHVPPNFRNKRTPVSPHPPKYQGSPPHGNRNRPIQKGGVACGNNCLGRHNPINGIR